MSTAELTAGTTVIDPSKDVDLGVADRAIATAAKAAKGLDVTTKEGYRFRHALWR